MADIVLVEHSGQTWLVCGVAHIDDLLAGRLNPSITTEFVVCESPSGVAEMFDRLNVDADPSDAPWLIHPAIAARLRGRAGEHQVMFSPWSAMLDDGARAVITAAAARANECAGVKVMVRTYLAADHAQIVADLTNLRAGVVEALLLTLGVAPHCIVRDMADAGSQTERIGIFIGGT